MNFYINPLQNAIQPIVWHKKLTAMRTIQTTPTQTSKLVNSYLHFPSSLSRLIVFNSTRSNASHRIDDQHIQHTKSTQHNTTYTRWNHLHNYKISPVMTVCSFFFYFFCFFFSRLLFLLLHVHFIVVIFFLSYILSNMSK